MCVCECVRERERSSIPPEPGATNPWQRSGVRSAPAKEHLGDTHYENGRALPAVSRSDRVSFCRRWSYLYAA